MSPGNFPEENERKRRFPSAARVTLLLCGGIVAVLVLANLGKVFAPVARLLRILTPVTMGLVLAYLLHPFLSFFENRVFRKPKSRRMIRALSLLSTYLLFFALVAGFCFLVIPQLLLCLSDFQTNGQSYMDRLILSVARLCDWLMIPGQSGDRIVLLFTKILSDYGTHLLSYLGRVAAGGVRLLLDFIVGLFISLYVLLDKERLGALCRRAGRSLFSPERERKMHRYVRLANKNFGVFFLGKFCDAFLVYLLCALLFRLFRFPYAPLLSLMVGVTALVPFFGPLIGAIPAAVLILIISPGRVLPFFLLVLLIQQLEINLITPALVGNFIGLSSLGVLAAVTVFGNLFGFAGMLVAVPVTGVILVISEDYFTARLRKKGLPTQISSYYPADAFLSPADDASRGTATHRFIEWVRRVQDEPPPQKGEKGYLCRAASRNFRRGCFFTARFFLRIFSTKPLPEDRSGTVYDDIRRHGIRTNCTLPRTVFLSLVTLFVYPFYLLEVIAQSTNIACHKDGKRTWGVVAVVIFSLLTAGIYLPVWHCGVIRRHRAYCRAAGEPYDLSCRRFVLLSLLLPVGTFFALSAFFRGFTRMAVIYNTGHGH